MFCSKCGTQNADDSVFCLYCGCRISTAPLVSVTADLPVPAQEESADYDNSLTKKRLPRNLTLILGSIAAVLICLTVFLAFYINRSDGISVITMRSILRDCGYPESALKTLKVEHVIKLNQSNTSSDNTKLALISTKTNEKTVYDIKIVDTEEKKAVDVEFSYEPLNKVMVALFEGDKNTNKQNAENIASYIDMYGASCFDYDDNCISYLRFATGKDGFISTAVAQRTITETMQPAHIHLPENFTVIFEKDNANPMYYASLSLVETYNWEEILPEKLYSDWNSNADSSAQTAMLEKYGEAYVMQDMWIAENVNSQAAGTFDSKETMKTVLTSPTGSHTAQGDNTNKEPIKTTIVYKINDSSTSQKNIKDNLIRTAKKQGYSTAAVISKKGGILEVIIPGEKDLDTAAEKLKDSMPFTITNAETGKVILTENDLIEKKWYWTMPVDNNPDDECKILLKLTDSGFKKLKSTASADSSNSNSKVNIVVGDAYLTKKAPIREISDYDKALLIGGFKESMFKKDSGFRNALTNAIRNTIPLELVEIR